MKNILHIMDYAAPYSGNFIRSIQFLEKEINADRGHLIYLFPKKAQNLYWIKQLINEGGRVYFIENTFFLKIIIFSNIKFIRDIIKSEKVSIIHTHFMNYNYSLFLLKILYFSRTKFIGHFHNHFLPPRNKYRKLKILITNLTYDLIIGVSDSVAFSVKEARINPNKVISISNALDFSRLDNYEQIYFSGDNKLSTIMMFGWPFYRKGVDIAIEAVRQLYTERSNILLVISLAGEKEYFENEIVNRLGQIPTWLKILEPRDDVASYYNASDIFLSASREEGFSYALVEAAFCKPLLISSNIPAPVSLKIPHLFTYQVENPEDLKNVIYTLLNMSIEQVGKIKFEQKIFVKRNFDLYTWAERVKLCYSEI